MSILWVHFAFLISAQLLLFLIHAYYEKKLAKVPRVLLQGAICGIVIGPLADLFAKYTGIATYLLGFGPFFLILLGVLGWGLGFANVFLMQKARLLHFCLWMMVVIVTSEIINLFFPLWEYPFPHTSVTYVAIALLSPLALAMGIAFVWEVFFGRRFVFIDNIFKK